MIKGIDVSKHQNIINWAQVKADGVKVAIIRAGYGMQQTDAQFKNNIEGCVLNGISVGIYWFIYAKNIEEVKKNAEKCASVILPYKNHITHKVWADWEYDSDARCPGLTNAQRTEFVRVFCETLKQKGFDVGVYANLDYLKTKFNDLSEYPLWYAQYSMSRNKTFDCVMWQFTSKGHVNGIIGNVDMNECYMDEIQSVKPHIASRRVLKFGSQGSDVIVMQRKLLDKGFDCKGIDGQFGKNTLEAVKAFQKSVGITVDGKCGPITWTKLDE